MKKVNLNIENLTDLWRISASSFQGYLTDEQFEYARILKSQWPNRIWVKKPLTTENVEITTEKLNNANDNLTFSHFYIANKNRSLNSNEILKLKSVQYGMSLPLINKFKTDRNLDFKLVENQADAQIWSNAFYQSFSYKISAETIINTHTKVPFYLVYFENEIIGTIILFATKKTAGIHSLGIIPEKRKQGFATEIMYHILNKSIDQNLNLATLQASKMAKEMYLKMGFSIDFLMENYQLK